MKKITISLLAILILSALALSSLGCNVDWREAVTTVFSGTEARAIQRLDLNIPEEICKVEVLRETHSGMQNDGESVYKITFSEDAEKYFSDWNELPLSAEAEDSLHYIRSYVLVPLTDELREYADEFLSENTDDDEEGALILPPLGQGLWKLKNRGEISGHIAEFTFGFYDAESNTAYIIENDM